MTPPITANILALVSDAFGGHGGIAAFNRDLATALAGQGGVRLRLLPRRTAGLGHPIPPSIRQDPPLRGKLLYGLAALWAALRDPPQVIVCGHVNLLPLARLVRMVARWRHRAVRLALVIHGIEVWTPFPLAGLDEVDGVISVSRVTQDRFGAWSGFPRERSFLLPNTTDMGQFQPGDYPRSLAQRLGLCGRKVLLTLARLAPEDRDKGFVHVMRALPAVLADHPDLCYVIAGEGGLKPWLQEQAESLGLADHVLFPGFVSEAEKVDFYRLADAFVLCGRQEGFGIVLLEAMACGVPVVASRLDGSCEVVEGGRLGYLADPDNPQDLADALGAALDQPKGSVHPDLVRLFGPQAFAQRATAILNQLQDM